MISLAVEAKRPFCILYRDFETVLHKIKSKIIMLRIINVTLGNGTIPSAPSATEYYDARASWIF